MWAPWVFRVLLFPVWIVSLVLIYWLIDYETWNPIGGPPLNISGKILTPEVEQGGVLMVRYDWEVLRDCPRQIELWINNGQPHLLSSHHGTSSGKGPAKYSKLYNIPLPRTIEPGDAILRSVSVWKCNPLKPLLHSFDLSFSVEPRED